MKVRNKYQIFVYTFLIIACVGEMIFRFERYDTIDIILTSLLVLLLLYTVVDYWKTVLRKCRKQKS